MKEAHAWLGHRLAPLQGSQLRSDRRDDLLSILRYQHVTHQHLWHESCKSGLEAAVEETTVRAAAQQEMELA